MAQAENCNEKCDNYEYCKEEGNTGRFIAGSECSDFSPKEEVK